MRLQKNNNQLPHLLCHSTFQLLFSNLFSLFYIFSCNSDSRISCFHLSVNAILGITTKDFNASKHQGSSMYYIICTIIATSKVLALNITHVLSKSMSVQNFYIFSLQIQQQIVYSIAQQQKSDSCFNNTGMEQKLNISNYKMQELFNLL